MPAGSGIRDIQDNVKGVDGRLSFRIPAKWAGVRLSVSASVAAVRRSAWEAERNHGPECRTDIICGNDVTPAQAEFINHWNQH